MLKETNSAQPDNQPPAQIKVHELVQTNLEPINPAVEDINFQPNVADDQLVYETATKNETFHSKHKKAIAAVALAASGVAAYFVPNAFGSKDSHPQHNKTVAVSTNTGPKSLIDASEANVHASFSATSETQTSVSASEAKYELRSKPFDLIEDGQTKWHSDVNNMLRDFNAEFHTAWKDPYGIEINEFRYRGDAKSKKLGVSPEKMHNLITQILENGVDSVVNSTDPATRSMQERIKAEWIELKYKASKGQLNAQFNMLYVGNQDYCMEGTTNPDGSLSNIGIYFKPGAAKVHGCQGDGLNSRNKQADISPNQVVTVMRDDYNVNATGLSTDDKMNLTLSHELTHTLIGLTGLNNLTLNVEHKLAVDPNVGDMYYYFKSDPTATSAKPISLNLNKS